MSSNSLLTAETHTVYLQSKQVRQKIKLYALKYAWEKGKQGWEDLNSLSRAA